MRKVKKTLRAMGYAAPVALTLALAAPAMGHEPMDKNMWSAKKEDTAWVTGYNECWKSKMGPDDLVPCRVEAAVPEEVTVRLNFKFDKFMVPDDVVNHYEVTKIDDYIEQLRATPEEEVITVVGHTDAKGSDKYNMNLGLHRAEAVRNYIISRGYMNVAPAESMGEGMLLPEYDPYDLAQRRVMLRKTLL